MIRILVTPRSLLDDSATADSTFSPGALPTLDGPFHHTAWRVGWQRAPPAAAVRPFAVHL